MGNVLLESHDALEGSLGNKFEAFILDTLEAEHVSHDEFACAVQALQVLRATLAALEALPE
ncbi:hypothetical protein E5CHR_02903 [Variovorax sp. PBL-E5]|nr:hypothetical protein E5CHR_02903 [Variovorax sp. PBL-E5]